MVDEEIKYGKTVFYSSVNFVDTFYTRHTHKGRLLGKAFVGEDIILPLRLVRTVRFSGDRLPPLRQSFIFV